MTNIILHCYNPIHNKNSSKEYEYANINTKLHHNEMTSENVYDGISNIEYELLSSFELAPRFTIMNVDFRLLVI